MLKNAFSIVALLVFVLHGTFGRTPAETGSFHDFHGPEELTLLPETPFTGDIHRSLSELDPDLGIEALFELPGIPGKSWDDQRLTIFRILQSISTMEGIEYYSASRGYMRVFYLESYVIPSRNTRTRIPDPVARQVPETAELYAFQRDSSFGRNVQKISYRSSADAFFVEIENQTQMFYSFVPLVGPQGMKVSIIIRNSGDGLQFYGNLGVRVPATFGMEEKARDSFRNRIIALYTWFDEEISAVSSSY